MHFAIGTLALVKATIKRTQKKNSTCKSIEKEIFDVKANVRIVCNKHRETALVKVNSSQKLTITRRGITYMVYIVNKGLMITPHWFNGKRLTYDTCRAVPERIHFPLLLSFFSFYINLLSTQNTLRQNISDTDTDTFIFNPH